MPTPILYAPSGQPVAFELTGDERRTELLLTSFGLLSGIMAQSGELAALAERYGGDAALFVNAVCSEIVKLLGVETVKARFPGLKLQMGVNEALEQAQKARIQGPLREDEGSPGREAHQRHPSGFPTEEQHLRAEYLDDNPPTDAERAFPGPRLVDIQDPEP